MEVRLAKSAGFCFGVKRAVDKVYEQIEMGKTIYTYGPIIHNEEVVKDLEEKGVQVIPDKDELQRLVEKWQQSPGDEKGGAVIIRSHGVSKEIHDMIENSTLECIDATCPFVKRIHKIVQKESMTGKHIVIVGSPIHPEVEGIVGWCEGTYTVLETEEEAANFEISGEKEICLVSQTTFNYNKFQHIVAIFQKKGYNVIVVNTICNATEERQTEAREIAQQADIMIVIGGKHSSNTRKLYEICSSECANTYFIQTLDDLHLELPKAAFLVGITAGASTPNKLIEEVQNYVRINF